MNFLNALCDMWFIRNGEQRSSKVYRAKVVDNKDPLAQNRLKVYIPELMKGISGIWARPSYHFRKQAITPQIGDVVLIVFENGNFQLPVYVGHVRLTCPQGDKHNHCGYIREKIKDYRHTPEDYWLLETPDNRRFRANDYGKQIQIESFNTKRIIEIDDRHKYIEARSEKTSRRIRIDDSARKIILKTPKGIIEIDDNEPHIDARIGHTKAHLTPWTAYISCESSHDKRVIEINEQHEYIEARSEKTSRRIRIDDNNRKILVETPNSIIEIDDNKPYIEARSKNTNRKIKIDDADKRITIETPKGIIEIDDNEPHIDARIGHTKAHLTPSTADVSCGLSNIHMDNHQIRAKASVIMLN